MWENAGASPLTPEKVAHYEAGADVTRKGGTGSGVVKERHVESSMEGLEKVGFTVTTKPWISAYAEEYRKGEETYAADLRRRLMKPDAVNMMGTPYQYPFGQRLRLKTSTALTRTPVFM